jgi:hypothetical protein
MTARTKMALLFIGVLALAMMMVPGLAFANAGVHGNYDMNTDQCAGCHRAHTAPSQTTWVNTDGATRSALLLGSYTELYQFCLTCHGAAATGADTNVEEGIYEARVTAGSYGTVGGALISGPFGVPYPTPDSGGNYYSVDAWGKRVTSTHDYFGGSWGAYGGGIFGTTATVAYDASLIPSIGVGSSLIKMDCGTCHDVHGSSNYRLLKDKVYGVQVGGYLSDASETPTPWVLSNEPGFPSTGFRLHVNAISGGYTPDYTVAQYRKPPSNDRQKGMSGWCVGCHTFYMGDSVSIATTYNAGDVFGTVERHRHPINVPLSNFKSVRSIDLTGNPLPLAHDSGETTTAADSDDWVDCMTCHYAHGTTAVMTGYANVADPTDMIPDSGDGGVAPTDDSALLRYNNRYVCEACHNK